MRKWTYELIIIAVLLCVAGGIWWFTSTKDERQAKAQFEQLIRFAQHQQIEIAVIKQAAELQQLRVAMQKAQIPTDLPQNPTIIPSPVIADPKDVP